MFTKTEISLLTLVNCISSALDLVNPSVINHHKRVAYIGFRLAEELKLPLKDIQDIVLAGLLHDIGLLSLHDRLDALDFEIKFENQNLVQHGLLGQHLLKKYFPHSKVPLLIGAHHLYWKDKDNCPLDDQTLLGSQIIHLADRMDVLIDRNDEILGQSRGIVSRIETQSGLMFCPELVKVLQKLAVKEYFWLDIVSPQNLWPISAKLELQMAKVDSNNLLNLAKTFCHIIDFRSPFTATHSVGVSASSQALAELMDFKPDECFNIKIAGYLHDLGKLAIPNEILEKPGKLTDLEFNIIKAHTYYGYRMLEKVPGMELINTWGTLHHERLDGRGYPFHLNAEQLSIGSRIMAVADIFTALLEDRPYRKSMSEEKALQIILKHAEDGALDENIVSVLKENISEINLLQNEAQKAATLEYQEFRALQGY